MLTAHQISKSYGIDPLLENISFNINSGERVGLIGPNGCGKSTLLRILAGEEQPDSGQVTRTPGDLSIGYLKQGLEPTPGQTFEAWLRKASGDPDLFEQKLEKLTNQLATTPHRRDLLEAYDQLLAQMEGWNQSSPGQLKSILAALELDRINPQQAIETLSGGQKTRLSLALVLLNKPQLLLLDEPTNHLDISVLEWLEDWINNFQGGVLIVSHDRAFLDHTITRVLDLNPDTHTTKSYSGNYSAYLEQYLIEVEKYEAEYKNQEAEIRRIRQDIARTKEQARWVEVTTTSRQPSVRRYAKKVAQKALSREKKLERYLDSEDRVEKPKSHWQMKLEFGPAPPANKRILEIHELAIGYPGYEPLLQNINMTVYNGERIVLTGPNGCGKTTLLRTLAGQLAVKGGNFRMGSGVMIGYLTQEQEMLDPELSALETIQSISPMNETEARTFLHLFLFSGDDSLRPAKQLSYGERSRLELASLIVKGCDFLLLDEPINHLDIPSRERFEQALATYQGSILTVVHDRYFIDRFASQLWLVDEGTVQRRVLVSDIED